MAYRIISRVHVDKIHLILAHWWKAEVLKKVVVEIDIGLAGVKHNSVAVENDDRYFVHEIPFIVD
jgi:hypothetical protein